MADIKSIIVRLEADLKDLKSGLAQGSGEIDKFTKKSSASVDGLGKSFASLIASAAIGRWFVGIINEADTLDTTLGILQQKILNLGGSSDWTKDKIHALANQMAEGSKFIDDEVVAAFDRALTKTRDWGSAHMVVSDAMKLATVTGLDLKVAADGLSLAYQGNTRGLALLAKEMGLNVRDGASYATIMAEVNKQFKGMNEVLAGDLTTNMKKMKDEFNDSFVNIIRPNLPIIINLVKYFGIAIGKAVDYLKLFGTFWGSLFGMIYTDLTLLIQLITGKISFKQFLAVAKDQFSQFAEEVKGATIDLLTFAKVKDALDDIAPPKPGKGPAAGISEEDKAEADLYLKYLIKKRKDANEEQERLNDEFKKGLAKIDDEIKKDSLGKEEAYYQRIVDLRSATAESLTNLTMSLLQGEANAWRNWANQVIAEIMRVIAKRLILNALTAMTGGTGGIFGAIAGLFGSPAAAGSPVIQVYSNDPATVVRVVNGAFSNASPGSQARLSQIVARGNIANSKR